MSCDGGIVSRGDARIDLLGKCGPPTLVESHQDERTALVSGAFPAAGSRVLVERWTYDRGPNQFIMIALLEAGKVVGFERGGYGYAQATARKASRPIPRAQCANDAFHVGDSTYEVLARCSDPAFVDVRQETRMVDLLPGPGGSGTPVFKTVEVEVWTYDFGPRTLVRFLVFCEGKLLRIETGSYGYAL
jgi:hypothetical protein